MNKRTFPIILSFALVILACQPKSEPLLIPSDDLIKALADVHIAEGALLSIRPVVKDSIRDLYYSQIYEIHGITPESFEHDIGLLKLNPKLMEKVYEKVMEELNNREDKRKEKKDKDKKKEEEKPKTKK